MINNLIAITRLNKPTGLLLLACPVAWALWLASEGQPALLPLMIFMAGVFLMRPAGCIINDIFDRDFDAHLARTAERPLAKKSMSVTFALGLFVLLMAAAASLLFYLNHTCRILALIAAGMTIIYPLCKRYTYLPQLVLGLTFNMGVLMVFAQLQNKLSANAWLMYFAAVSWTMAYDTIYAMQDQQEDQNLGIKSTALLFQHHTITFLYGFYALTLVLFSLCIQTWSEPVVTLFSAAVLLVLLTILQVSQKQYWRAFNTNIMIGLVLFGSVVMSLGL